MDQAWLPSLSRPLAVDRHSLGSGKLDPLLQEESQHFTRGIGALRIGVSAVPAAAGPGMPTAMDEPLLHHNLPGRVPSHRAGMSASRGVTSLSALDVLTLLGGPHNACSVRRMDDVVRIAVEDDGANARPVVCHAARLPGAQA